MSFSNGFVKAATGIYEPFSSTEPPTTGNTEAIHLGTVSPRQSDWLPPPSKQTERDSGSDAGVLLWPAPPWGHLPLWYPKDSEVGL